MELKFGRILNDELSLLKIPAIVYSIAPEHNNTIEADVKGRAALVLALIHCFLGIFVMPCSLSHRSLWVVPFKMKGRNITE